MSEQQPDVSAQAFMSPEAWARLQQQAQREGTTPENILKHLIAAELYRRIVAQEPPK